MGLRNRIMNISCSSQNFLCFLFPISVLSSVLTIIIMRSLVFSLRHCLLATGSEVSPVSIALWQAFHWLSASELLLRRVGLTVCKFILLCHQLSFFCSYRFYIQVFCLVYFSVESHTYVHTQSLTHSLSRASAYNDRTVALVVSTVYLHYVIYDGLFKSNLKTLKTKRLNATLECSLGKQFSLFFINAD